VLSQVPEVLKSVVYEAEDGDDEGAKIHESGVLLLASVGLGATERRGFRSLFNRSENLHTGLVRRQCPSCYQVSLTDLGV
jgi:hypothetical protein